jgi:hypothetical protein
MPALADLLRDLEEQGAALDLTGFSSEEVAKLVQSFDAESGALPENVAEETEWVQMSFTFSASDAARLRVALDEAKTRLEDGGDGPRSDGRALLLLALRASA